MQVGPSVDYLVSLPLSKAEAALDPAWYDHYCFAGMGDHFLQFDYTPTKPEIIPLFISSSARGTVTGMMLGRTRLRTTTAPTTAPL